MTPASLIFSATFLEGVVMNQKNSSAPQIKAATKPEQDDASRGTQAASSELSHAQHHEKAAEHHQHAADHHNEAAKHYGSGDDAKGAHHAHVASGHGLLAKQHAYEANMHFSKKHGAKRH